MFTTKSQGTGEALGVIAMSETVEKRLGELSKQLENTQKEMMNKSFKDLIIVQNRIYSQLEALTWLSQALTLSGSLPPLRGWAASPDVLLRLHEHIRFAKPKVVVECGSGSSTLVIADALRQNGEGILVSLEHSPKFGGQTQALLEREGLAQWVDLRIADLEPWAGPHLNSGTEEALKWYATASLSGVRDIDLLFVDGPPGATCKYARYPALPAFFDRLAQGAEVWLDDTVRREETEIGKEWAEKYSFDLEFCALEKGLGVLTPSVGDRAPATCQPVFSGLNGGVDAGTLKALESHIRANSPGVALQFGVSSVTLQLAQAIKKANVGRLICISEPSEEVEIVKKRARADELEGVITFIPSSLKEWPYQQMANCEPDLNLWFEENVLSQLPAVDWVLVDGPDWRGQPCTRYPALPSVIETLSTGAEVWMFGAEDARVREVVAHWCTNYSAEAGSEANGHILKVRL